MKKLYRHNDGFVLIVAITLMVIITFIMAFMSHSLNNFAFQTNQIYLNAYRDNLTVSGLAWAGHNPKQLPKNKSVELDTSLLAPRSELKMARAERDKVRISVLCHRARQKTHSDDIYVLDKK